MKNKHLYSIAIKALFVILLFASYSSLFAQLSKINLEAESDRTQVLENSFNSTRLHFSFDHLKYTDVETREGLFTELIMPNGYNTGKPGMPKLPALKNLIEIPFGAEVKIEVINYTTQEYDLADFEIKHPLMPVQPSLRKDQDIKSMPFWFSTDKYNKSELITPDLASVEVLGVLRGMRIGRLTVAPVSYNPQANKIIVYNNIELEIQYEGYDKALTNYIKASTYSPYFGTIYNRVVNPFSLKDVFDEYPDLTTFPIKMVIVSHPDFEEVLQPFIEWKTRQGFKIIQAYTDIIGETAPEIKNFIHEQYNEASPEDPAPTFVVLAGDSEKIPASDIGSQSASVTDLYYASVDGDYFPEMYIGRLSARDVQEMQNQIDKILYYQKYEFEDPSYLNNTTLIAGEDSYWNPRIGEPTVKYATENYFNISHGFNTIWGYGVDNDPNNPDNNPGYTGCYDQERISVSMINFTAHCSPTSWSDPNLYASDIHNFTNTGKYPLAIGNCCQSAQFSHSESIGEAWMRAENKGAVAYVGSVPNTHWFEDFYWAVGAFPISGNNDGYVPSTEETTLGGYDAPFVSDYQAVASKKFVGNLAITEAHLQSYPTHSNVQYYWEAYHTLGDPSTYIYLTEGDVNVVSHMENFPLNTNTFTINAEPGSYVGISKDGVLHGAALVGESGEVDVPITPVMEAGNVSIVVTKPKYQPYITIIPTAKPPGPFVVLDSFEVNDSEFGNDNGLIDYGETFSLHFTVKNIGDKNAKDVAGKLLVDDKYYTLLSDTTVAFGDVDADEEENTVTITNAYTLVVAENVPDQYNETFDFIISDNEDNNWLSKISLNANAPELTFHDLIIDDDGEGIPGILEPGETADVIINIKNTGHSTTEGIDVWLEIESDYVTVNTEDTINIEQLAHGETAQIIFNVTASENTPLEQPIDFIFNAATGEYLFDETKEILIGSMPEYIMGESPTVDACIGKFYDSGGPDNHYSNNEDNIMTFYPAEPDHKLEFEFLKFEVEAHDDCQWDWLAIYDGESTDASLIGKYCGNNSPESFMASNEAGAITFHFKSDGSITKPGWEAIFQCVDLNQPPLCADKPSPADEQTNVILTPERKLEWNKPSGAMGYDVYFGQNTLPDEVTFNVSQNYTEIEIESNTDYAWKVIPYNTAGHAENCPEWSFSTGSLPDIIYMTNIDTTTCNAVFYDSGGPNYDYSNLEHYVLTFYPNDENAYIITEFEGFDVEYHTSCSYDWLKIYNGENTSADLIGIYCGENSPGKIIADNEPGALTFEFYSDYSITRPGWEAHVYCKYTERHTVNFHIYDENEKFVENAVITFDEDQLEPDVYYIEDVLPGSYNFVVSKNGFYDAGGSIEVTNSDVDVFVTLKEKEDPNLVHEIHHEVKIFPNPTKGIVTIEMKEMKGTVDLILMNYQGQVILNNTIEATGLGFMHMLDMKNYSKGIYYLRIQSGGFTGISKIILQ